MKYGIDKYVGNWKNEEGYRLEIRKIDKANAIVSLFSPLGPPISRPYWNNKETIDMPAHYDEYMGYFDVQLWEPQKEFCLNLAHDYSTRNIGKGEEVLAPGLTRYEKDNHLDSFYNLFGKLSDYKRETIK
jgi:hypothetical protein